MRLHASQAVPMFVSTWKECTGDVRTVLRNRNLCSHLERYRYHLICTPSRGAVGPLSRCLGVVPEPYDPGGALALKKSM